MSTTICAWCNQEQGSLIKLIAHQIICPERKERRAWIKEDKDFR